MNHEKLAEAVKVFLILLGGATLISAGLVFAAYGMIALILVLLTAGMGMVSIFAGIHATRLLKSA